jgi:hypothetical protein
MSQIGIREPQVDRLKIGNIIGHWPISQRKFFSAPSVTVPQVDYCFWRIIFIVIWCFGYVDWRKGDLLKIFMQEALDN